MRPLAAQASSSAAPRALPASPKQVQLGHGAVEQEDCGAGGWVGRYGRVRARRHTSLSTLAHDPKAQSAPWTVCSLPARPLARPPAPSAHPPDSPISIQSLTTPPIFMVRALVLPMSRKTAMLRTACGVERARLGSAGGRGGGRRATRGEAELTERCRGVAQEHEGAEREDAGVGGQLAHLQREKGELRGGGVGWGALAPWATPTRGHRAGAACAWRTPRRQKVAAAARDGAERGAPAGSRSSRGRRSRGW